MAAYGGLWGSFEGIKRPFLGIKNGSSPYRSSANSYQNSSNQKGVRLTAVDYEDARRGTDVAFLGAGRIALAYPPYFCFWD